MRSEIRTGRNMSVYIVSNAEEPEQVEDLADRNAV